MSGGNWLGRRRVWLVTVAWAMVVSIATVVLPVRPVAAACDDITVTTGQGGSGVAAAIDEANACDGFLTIFIEPGTYSWGGSTITDTVTITAADPALPPTLTGAGQGSRQFNVDSASGTVTLERLVVQGGFRAGLLTSTRSTVVLDAVSFVGSTTTCGITTADAIRVDAGDLTVRSSGIGASGCSGILAFNAPAITLDDVEIAAMAQHGVRTDGPLTVTNSRIHANGLTGITLSGTDSATISGSAIYANGDDGIASSPTPLTVRNSVIGLEPDGAGGLLPAGNRDMGIDARFADVTIENVVVAHNRRGVSLANVTSTISGSEIRDHANVGLSLSRTTATIDTTDLRDNSPTDCGLFLSTIVDAGDNTDSDDTCGFAQPNSPPTADVDRFQTDEDAELNAAAPGVLEGDVDPDGDQITAELVTGPANALSFELFADGSFDYVPALDYYGVDTFEYRATDGAAASPPTLVEIVVRPINDEPTIAVPGPATADLDTVVPLPIVVGDVDADDPPGEEDTVVPVAFVIADSGTLAFDDAAHPEVVATFGGAQSQLFLDGEIGSLASAAATGISWQPDAGFEGTATFDAAIRDRGENGAGSPLEATESFEITVADLNQPPLAVDDGYDTREDTTLVIAAPGLLANDSDPDGDPLESSVVDEPTLGTVDVGVDGSFTYSPDPDANGTDTFTYVASDGSLDSDPATVTIDIESVSEPWTLDVPSEVVTDEDVPVVFTGLLTDVDELVTAIAAGTTLGAVDVAGPAPNGTVTFTVTPDPDVSGTGTISIGVTDIGGTTLEFVSLVVDPVNDPPVIAAPADVATDEDSPVSFDLTVSDVETEADALSVSVTTPPAVGTVSWVGPDALGIATVTFAPAPDANGAPLGDLTIEVDDGTDASSAAVAVTVAPVNDAPVAAPDAYTTDEDVELAVAAPGVLGNDADVDTAAPTAVVESAPANGALVLAPDGGFTYTPDPQFSGSDSFTYRATDGVDVSAPVVAAITVNAVNDAPTIAGPAEVTTDEDVAVTLTVTVADVETAATDLAITADVPPAVGTVAVGPIAADGSADVTFAPEADVNGEGLGPITMTVDDGDDASVLSVDVTIDPVDDPPVAAGDEYTTPEDTQLVVDAAGVLTNDTDVDGDQITARLVDPPSAGALELRADGSFTYTPDLDAFGDVTFTYVAENAGGSSDAVEVTITVEPVDDPPTIDGPATTSFDEDTLATVAVTVSDPDTALVDLVVSADLPPSVGTTAIAGPDAAGQVIVTIDPNPDLNGDPVGDLVVTVSDDMSSVDLVVSVTIDPVNDPPVGNPDTYTTDEDTTLTITAPGVLANDTDVDGDVITVSVDSEPGDGDLTLASDGGFTYTPDPDTNGTDAFTYIATDGVETSGPITVTIDVAPRNDAPVGRDDSYMTDEDTALTVGAPGVLGNDTDLDGDPLIAIIDTDPTSGTATLDPDGSFTYTPDPDTNGTDTFTYIATDGLETSGPITVTIEVLPINDPPVAELVVTPDTTEIGNPVTADGSTSSDTDDSVLTFRFDWGDGIVTESANATAVHTYDSPGLYTVTLVVVDAQSLESQPSSATVVVGDGSLRVNTELDAPDLDPTDGLCWTGGFVSGGEPACSFRAAVEEANGRGVASVIRVPAGDFPGGGFLPVNVPVTIEGAGVDETRIGSGWNLVQFAGGDLRDFTFSGALNFFEGRFDVHRIAVADGSATAGSYVVIQPLADVSVLDSVFATDQPGSLVWVGGLLTASNLRIEADRHALMVTGGQVELTDSTITVESAYHIGVDGGGSLVARRLTIPKTESFVTGVLVEDGSVELTESFVGATTALRLSEPTSVAILERSTVDGYVPVGDGNLTATSSTIDGLVSVSAEATGTIRWSTISRQLRLRQGEIVGTVVTGSGSETDLDCDLGPTVVAKGNADSSGSCGGIASSNLRLGPLADNGGPTPTRLPQPGSDLVDAADDSCPAFDQRGVARPIDGSNSGVAICDIGAVEAPAGSGTVPIAALTADPERARPGETVTFDASGSFDPDGSITAYGFDFGDGTGVSLPDPVVTHTYDSIGVYFPTVTVVDDDQQVSVPETIVVRVQTAPLTADLDVTPPVAAVGAAVTADGSGSTSPDSTIVSYEIDWGDGTLQTSDQPTTTHDYDAPGEYTVTLIVTDALGATSPAATSTVVAYGDALVVNTTIDEPDLDAADGICFTGEFVDTGEPACSLRAAVEEANARGGPAVIELPAGTFDTGSSIVRAEVELTLVGAGRDLTTVGIGPFAYSVLLGAGGTVTDLTFGNRLVAFGTSLHVENVLATDSTGLLVTDDGDLTAVDVEATGFGSALDVQSGTADVQDSNVQSVRVTGGTATLTDIEAQNAFVSGGVLDVRRSGLAAASISGGVVDLEEVSGGVIFVGGPNGDVGIRRSTLATVSVGPDTTSDVSVDSSTISDSITALSGTVWVTSSTVRLGVSTDGPTSITGSAIGAVGSGTSCALTAATPTLTDNIDVDGSCGGGAVGDLLLGPLADNGGPTLTYLPLPGSPVVDAAGTACPARDQRGAPRPIDGNDDTTVACDAGAVEAPSGSGGTMPPAQIDVEIRFAGAPIDDEPFDVDVELVAPSDADVAELTPIAADPGWPGTSNGCSGGLLDSTGERPTCSGTFTIAAETIVDVDVLATNSGDSPYPTFSGDCAGGALTVGRGVALTCTITFVRPDIGDSDPSESAILRLDKRWVAPLATEPPDATIGVDVAFGGFTADIPVPELRDGPLSADACTVPTDCEYYVAFRPAPLDLGVTIPDLVVIEEELPDGWQAFFGDDCTDGRIDDPQPGELLTCTITNVEAPGPSPVLVEWFIEPVGSVLPIVEVEADLRFVRDGGDELFASVDQALPPADQPDVACEWIEPGVGDYPLVCRTVLDAAPGDYAVEMTTPDDDVWRRGLRDGCTDGQLTAEIGAVAICRVDLRKILPERYVDFSASALTPIVTEGDDERDAGVVEVVVEFDRQLTSEVELPWQVVPASATDAPDSWPMGDFTSSDVVVSEGVLSVPVGAAEARLQVEFVADRVVEPDDGFAVRITEPMLGGVVTVFGAIRNDDTAPTLEGVTATPDAGIYPLTITGEAVGGAGEIVGYRWWLRAPSGSTELFETTGATIELDLTEVGTFELRVAALDDAGNASHTYSDAPSTTIEVEDRVPVIEIDDLIVDEGDGAVLLSLLEDVDVVTAPGSDWSVRFASMPTSDPGPGGATPATPGELSAFCGYLYSTDFEVGPNPSFRLDRDGRFFRGPSDDPTYWDEFQLLQLCDDPVVEGLEYRQLAIIGWPAGTSELYQVLGEFNLFIVDDDDGDVRPIIDTPEVVTVSVPIGTTPPVKVSWTATATDPEDGELDVTCEPVSGSGFGFGTTTITCTAIDSAFHVVEDSFDVIVAEADDATVGDLAGAPVTRVPAGTAVRVRGGGYADGSDARIELRSDPVVLAERVVEDGSVDAVVSIPADTPPGEHTLVIVGTGADGTPRQTVLPIVVEELDCTITGTPGHDVLIGTRGDDVICGLGGDDLIIGGRGDDVVIAGDGDDLVVAGRGDDEVYGGAGDDALFGEQGDDEISGGDGDDLVLGGAGDDALAGGPGDDLLIGGPGRDLLIGGPGRDRLLGRPGRDEMID